MLEEMRHQRWSRFILGIIFPTLLAISISIGSIYVVIIPSFQENLIDGKREMIRELTNVAWSVMVLYRQEELAGKLSVEEAQEKALSVIEHLRYGNENKDYFWINDMHPRLIMHPYSKELVGDDLSRYEAPDGRRLFLDIRDAVEDKESAFIEYTWNKKHSTEKNVPKLSYVRKFEPWGWVIGTGVFLDDVRIKTEQMTDRLFVMSFSGVSVIALLLLYVTYQSLIIERRRRKAEEDLIRSRQKYKTLVETAVDPIMMIFQNKCIYASKGMERLLGYSATELELIDLVDIFPENPTDQDTGSLRRLFASSHSGGMAVGEYEVLLQQKSGRLVNSTFTISQKELGAQNVTVVSARDVSGVKKREQERENLIVELQTSQLFLNQPISNSVNGFISCSLNTSIRAAAECMTGAGRNAMLVSSASGTMIGLITDGLLRERVVAGNLSGDRMVSEIMESSLIYIDDTALVFEAILRSQERGGRHLVVQDSVGQVVGVISHEELLDVHRYSAAFMINEICNGRTVAEIRRSYERLPRMVKALTDSGAHAKNVTRIITSVSDAILGRLIDLAIEELGEPPVRFAFICMGSVGREEQTLATDQDNALIFEDVSEAESEAVYGYFHKFSTKVCTWLDQVGYDFCKGKVMAMNPKWCQPVSTWKEYFANWIAKSNPDDLMEVCIFFDFRCLYGDRRFTDELREFIKTKAANNPPFFYQLAQNTLLFKIPVDFFGKISVDTGGDHPDTFNIKHVLAIIVGYARIYAIDCSLECTNTLQRIDLLLHRNVLSREIHEDIFEAYNYLMQMRFKHQVRRIDNGDMPDNFVSLNELTQIEEEMMGKIFAQVGNLRKQLSKLGQIEIYF